MAFNNGPKLVTQGLNLLVDAGDPTSYPGTGTTWRDVVGGQNGIITGSVSYTSSFYGGLVFSGPTASVIFPTSSANFGTSSFTVELAFRPARIEGIHYLISKNSGSFPNWGIYLSGSGGSGKLFSEFRISSTVSCSVSSSTTFVTGSNYFVDVQLQPGLSGSVIYRNGGLDTGATGNGGGSLTTTGSLFIGNTTTSSSQAYSGSLFFTRIYQTSTTTLPYYNFTPTKNRIQVSDINPILVRALIIGGGGAGGSRFGGGGGGAGGFIEGLVSLNSNTYTIQVGAGGIAPTSTDPNNSPSTNGSNSSISNAVIAYGGGRGGNDGTFPGSGGSGGGSNDNDTPGRGILGQGFAGGIGTHNSTGGGGGGAGGTGSNAPGAYTGGNGGPGKASDISGVSTYYAGGGGGGRSGVGGIGGGGSGNYTNYTGNTGSVNTGGGGGASESGGAGNGGSGIIIIRYAGPPIAAGGTITSFGGDTIHTFTSTGSSTFTVF
jgi:hypothetical protein